MISISHLIAWHIQFLREFSPTNSVSNRHFKNQNYTLKSCRLNKSEFYDEQSKLFESGRSRFKLDGQHVSKWTVLDRRWSQIKNTETERSVEITIAGFNEWNRMISEFRRSWRLPKWATEPGRYNMNSLQKFELGLSYDRFSSRPPTFDLTLLFQKMTNLWIKITI